MAVPLYNAEIAPPEVRGSLVALQQLAITFGIMVSFWIDFGKVICFKLVQSTDITSLLLLLRYKLHRRYWTWTARLRLENSSGSPTRPRFNFGCRNFVYAFLPTVGSPRELNNLF